MFSLKSLFVLLFLPLSGNLLKSLVPVLSETADQRFLQKLIDREFLFLTQYLCGFADTPAIVINRFERVVLFHTYRVKVAGNRFIERELTFAIGLLHRTLASSVRIITGKNTVFPVYDRSH